MKIKKKRTLILFSIALLAVMFSAGGIREAKAYTTYNKLEIENMQLNKARIKSGSADSGGKHVETYWQQNPLDSYDKLTDITFARTVLEADTAGDYMLQIHCKNESGGASIGVKLYVNGEAYDLTVSGSSYQTVNKTVSLNQGKNSIVLAWVNWGYFDYINYPSELKVVQQSSTTKYYAFEAALNEVQLTPTNGFHNPDTTLYTAPIEYNSGDEEWQGSATFTAEVPSNIKSVDLHYYVTEYHSKSAQLAMSVNGGKEVKLSFSGTKTNEELTYSISEKTLTDAGFQAGKTNTIKFRQASASGGKVGLYFIELKEDSVEETTAVEVKTNRYEAENAYIIAGAKIKSAEGDGENWSKGSYVGEFAAANITASSQIDEYCSNIGYIQYRVSVEQSGYYKVTLGYATEVTSMTVYVTSGYEWSKLQLKSTSGWNNVGEESAYVYLVKGENSIWVTGPAAEEAWVNYDYIEVSFDEAAVIDTSKTVLLLDDGASGANSKVISKEEETTTAEEKEKTEKEESEESSLSPKTGIPVMAAVIILVLSAAGLAVTYKNKKEENE